MSADANPFSAPAQNSPARRGNRHGRSRKPKPPQNGENPEQSSGGEGGGRRRGRGAGSSVLALRPASLPPTGDGDEVQSTRTAAGAGNSRQPRQMNRGRGGLAGLQRMVNDRAFGGKLTGTETSSSALQADAAEFVPGQPLVKTPAAKKPPVNAPRKRRASKSTAPDILTRTHEDIEHGHYECPICTSEVERKSKVWSCHTCWTVFHLSCIKKWASNEGSAAARRQSISNGETPPPKQWRCPGCNLPKDEKPTSYTCWCGKETDPRPPTGIPPHSCGNTCGKDRVKQCPHPCQLICHAGPCPPCTYMGPTQPCFCGKHESTRRCVETDYENGWSCNEICDDPMPCGEHICKRPCHEGLCGACEEIVDATCYCGQEEQQILCHVRGDLIECKRRDSLDPDQGELHEWTGSFICAHSCNRTFGCGKHQCEKPCHPQEAEAAHCPRSPDVVSHCPCGKTSLLEFSQTLRQHCTDPIPNCDKLCLKPLACGHDCELPCHAGECLPCMKRVQISCVCGRTSSTTICHQGRLEPPQCMRVCHATLSCGRHACDERCCAGERRAAERQNSKKKRAPLGSAAPAPDLIEAEHICTRVCGRTLKCGDHACMELCHKGPCGSCREAIFHELPCHCGRTVLEPPLPCGTRPPPCRFQCERPKACGHPIVQHNCHQDDEDCPKCPYLVERSCLCGKSTLKNQQCWLVDVRCGLKCGKKLACGSHFCRKTCHKPGECEDAGGQACTQPCGKPKKKCGHPDENACHAPFPCKEDKSCTSTIFVTCECQAQKQEARCGASRNSEGNLTKTLPCNDECARLERNRRLAMALNIDTETHVDGGDHVPYSDDVLALFQQHPQWAQAQEREFRVFAATPDEKRLRFKPMPAAQRAFLHALAQDFGLDSESLDPEPHRHVLLLKTPRFVRSPGKTLAEAARVRAMLRAATAPVLVATAPAAVAKPAPAPLPVNALLIAGARFGLTEEDVRAALLPEQSVSIAFQPGDSVVLRPARAEALAELKPRLEAAALGASVSLCAVDAKMEVVHRPAEDADGWSRVAAKGGAAPRKVLAVPPPGGGNAFAALSGRVTFKKKKPVEVEVVDDWEAEMEREDGRRAEQAGAGEALEQAETVMEDGKGEMGDEAAVQQEKPTGEQAEMQQP